MARLLEAARPQRYYVAVLLMTTTGLRRGEICGLSWQDVNLAAGELRVRRTLSRVAGGLVLDTVKTERSRRRIPVHTGMVTVLKDWRKQQMEERLAASGPTPE